MLIISFLSCEKSLTWKIDMKSQAIGVFDHEPQQKHIATCLGEMIRGRGQQKNRAMASKAEPRKGTTTRFGTSRRLQM